MPSGGGGGGRATGRRAGPAAWSAVVAALCGALLAAASPARAQVPDVEAAFVARIAAERAAAGRSPLAVADDLVAVARRHSATMAAENRLYHNPALGSQVVNWVKVGENVGTGGTVDNIHAALMASSTHRDEILGAAFTQVGVGVATSGGALWVTQVFRLPETTAAPASPPPSPAPAAVPPPPTAPPTAAPVAPAKAARATATPAAAAARTAASRSAAPPRSAATTTAPPSTAPPTSPAPAVPPALAPPPGPASPPSMALAPVRVSASAAVPLQPGVAGAGMVAATLLWAVMAGVVRSAVLQPARRR